MTEPLIDQDDLAAASFIGPLAVMAYLRSVLTPEALKTYETFVASDGHLSSGVLSGGDLHRRIFGDDR